MLSRMMGERGEPLYIRSDNGPEFVSHTILKWSADSTIESALVVPAKPWQNGTDESLNGSPRNHRIRGSGPMLASCTRPAARIGPGRPPDCRR